MEFAFHVASKKEKKCNIVKKLNCSNVTLGGYGLLEQDIPFLLRTNTIFIYFVKTCSKLMYYLEPLNPCP